jgi:oligoendopeptidase F
MEELEIKKPIYQFLKPDIQVEWVFIAPYFEELKERVVDSELGILKWLEDRSELESFLEEDFAWRYIHMTSDTTREDYSNAFTYFATEVEPKIAPWIDLLNKKLMASPFISGLKKPPFEPFFKKINSQIKLYREENIPLLTELQLKQQEYGKINGSMSISFQGEVYTMEQAAAFLKNPDRVLRKEVFEKIVERRMEDCEAINQLLADLIALRQKVAENCGFKNFRDYSFEVLGRFDYGPQETNQFGESIQHEILPIIKEHAELRKQSLGLAVLKPWDMAVNISGKPALKPFENGTDLIHKSILCFDQIDPFFGECLRAMQKKSLFDVESRHGKAPGGYNYPLAQSGAPFIFMNSAGTFRDLTTMVHEGGHAIHTFLTRNLLLNDFKHLTSEIAELASMSMELISMKFWDVFFTHAEDLTRAKKDQLTDTMDTFPWVAIIDQFQNRFYTEPFTIPNLIQIWNQVYSDFGGGFCDWTGYETYRDHLWQKQLHIFEVPFYYIEYGIAGLGAIAIWKNFTENPEKAIRQYKEALSLGYTRSIPETYKAAGIQFDMSREYISSLASFVKKEIQKL